MATAVMDTFLRKLGREMRAASLGDRTDSQLVECALAGNDPAALEAVVRRHGLMVYRVCRRLLHNEQDAEDAFQATFLVFAQKLRSLRKQPSLASWLYGVARRVALKARARAATRRRHELRVPALNTDTGRAESQTALDNELSHLPERWRLPLVLCYLEGRTQDEAARQLGWSKITFRRRLDEARAALARRLRGRGCTWPAALSAVLLSDCVAPAVPPGLIGSTAEATASVAAGNEAQAIVPAGVAALTRGVLRTMLLTKLRTAAAVLLTVAALGGALSAYAQAVIQDRHAGDSLSAPTPQAPAAKPGKEDPRVRDVLELALKDAAKIREPFQRLAAYGLLAKAQARAGRQAEAKEILRKALEAEDREMGADALQHKDSRMIQFTEFQAEIGDLKGALEIAKDRVSDLNTDTALSRVAVVQAQAGDVKGAMKTAESIQAAPYKGDALREIAVRLAETGKTKEAEEVARRIADGIPAKCLALATIASLRARDKDREGAARLLPAVRAAAGTLEGGAKYFGPLTVAEAEAAAGKAEDALKTIATLENGVEYLEALRHLGESQAVRGEIRAARRTAEAMTDDYHQDQVLCQIVVAHVRAKQLPEAEKVAASIRHALGRWNALIEIAKAQAAAGRKDDARKSLAEALKLAEQVDNPSNMKGVRAAALAHSAAARASTGDVEGALAWAGQQGDPWVRAQARILIAETLAPGPRP
jgi:RNA polymerase sigma factor (sigma-70 family)